MDVDPHRLLLKSDEDRNKIETLILVACKPNQMSEKIRRRHTE